MWELDYKESWAPKNWCFWIVVLEKTLESPLDCKEIQPVHPKGDQSWVFIGRTNVEAEMPILWPPDVKSWFIWKDPDAGKDWGQEEKWTTEDEMAGWHHLLNGHEFGWTPGIGDGQGGLMCCSWWGHKESDMTEQVNWTEYSFLKYILSDIKLAILISYLLCAWHISSHPFTFCFFTFKMCPCTKNMFCSCSFIHFCNCYLLTEVNLWLLICLNLCSLIYCLGEGNDTPLQYSCLENPMDGGAW